MTYVTNNIKDIKPHSYALKIYNFIITQPSSCSTDVGDVDMNNNKANKCTLLMLRFF